MKIGKFIKKPLQNSAAVAIVALLLFALIANIILIPAAPVYAVTETFNTAGTFTWTAPAGVTSVTVEVWGGGGRGSTSTWQGGGGGGGAYSIKANITVVPGNNYTYVVGAGATTAAAGGDSWFLNTSTVLAKGGNSAADNYQYGALGGLASSGVGDTTCSGGTGANAFTTGKPSGRYGGGGGSSAGTGVDGTSATDYNGASAPAGGGNGGNGRLGSDGDGTAGSTPGGGGGGAYKGSGGNGAAGQVRITYQYNTTITVSPATGTYGGTASLTATLTINGGAPVSGKTINFTLNGGSVGSATTNSTGVANLPDASLAGIDPGTYPSGVGASFVGDADYIASSGTASLTVNPTPTSIDITVPDDISDWDLDPTLGENTYSGTLAVDVTPSVSTSWSVTAKDTDATTGGYMTEWSGSAYGTAKLENPMCVQGPAVEVVLPNSAGIDIATGEGDYPAINITFKQTVSWDDELGDYQIVVTFIGTVN